MSGTTLFEKIWQSHVVRSFGERALIHIDRHFVHEGTSRNAFDGLRQRGQGVESRAHVRGDRPRPLHAAGPHGADLRAVARTHRRNAGELPRVRAPAVRCQRSPAGHRPRHRHRARHRAARHDGRVRRQSHRDQRRGGGLGLGHRHDRGGAGARDPDAAAAKAEDDARQFRRHACRTASPPRTSSSI